MKCHLGIINNTLAIFSSGIGACKISEKGHRSNGPRPQHRNPRRLGQSDDHFQNARSIFSGGGTNALQASLSN